VINEPPRTQIATFCAATIERILPVVKGLPAGLSNRRHCISLLNAACGVHKTAYRVAPEPSN
jgi:hypothetical protein